MLKTNPEDPSSGGILAAIHVPVLSCVIAFGALAMARSWDEETTGELRRRQQLVLRLQVSATAWRASSTRFYRHMDEVPRAEGIRAMHERDLRRSREKLTVFPVRWLGGPNSTPSRSDRSRSRVRISTS